MDLNAFDFDLEPDSDPDLETGRSETGRPVRSLALDQAALKRQSAAAPTNSPGCTPTSLPNRAPRPIRSVRTDAWSVPASTSWARPSRALRKVARRALESEAVEPA